MAKVPIEQIGMKVGLEVHQQLATKKNYFVIVLQWDLMNMPPNSFVN